MVNTLRCGRRIPGSNPGRGMFLKKIKQFLKGTMLRLFCLLSYMIPLHLLLVTTGDLNMGADSAMVVMGAPTAGATLLFFLFLRVLPHPWFFFSSSSTCYRAGLVCNTSREVWEPALHVVDAFEHNGRYCSSNLFLHVFVVSILHLDQRPVSSIQHSI